MAVATLPRRKITSRAPVLLREDYSRTSTMIVVDEDKCIISGLKICGLISDNGYEYDKSALHEAMPFYDGVPCYKNHRIKGQQRDVDDDIGVWHNIREGSDGLYGDLWYDKTKPFAATLVNRAKNNPKNMGFSHDADTDPKNVQVREGRPFVTKIDTVNSVDLVARPATTSGLNEDRHVTYTVKSLLESARAKFSKARQSHLTKLLEDDTVADPLAAPAEAPTDPNDAMAEAFRAGLHAAVDAYVNGDSDLAAFVAQVKDIAKTHDKMCGKEEPEADKPDDSPADKPADEEKSKMESRIAHFERKEAVTELCESLKFTPTADQRKVLLECDSKTIRKELAGAYALGNARKGPRSGDAHRITESHVDRDENEDKKWASACLVK